MYKYYLFDLDGTLTDPGIGITNGVIHALKHYGIVVNERTSLYKFIGPPLLDSFMDYYGFTKEQSLEAIKFYREYYGSIGLLENEVYDGVKEVLTELKAKGYTLCLATSKPEDFTVRILKAFELYDYFDFIGAASMDESRNTKTAVIKHVLSTLQIKNLDEVLMIGDRHFDIDGANACGIDSCGVLYGYGDEAELKEAGARYIAAHPLDILKIKH